MPTREEVARYTVIQNALTTTLRTVPCSNPTEARRWARFACDCVLNIPTDDGLKPSPALEERPNCKKAFELAQRWVAGEEVTGDELHEAWREASRDAETLSTRMTGDRAARWSVLSAVEAAIYGADEDFTGVKHAVEAAARYARQANPAQSLGAAKFQKELVERMRG